jgi:hypothetical protein
MKALMSMFVEIIGMSMNNTNSNTNSNTNKGGGTNNMMYSNNDDDDDESDFHHQSTNGGSRSGSSSHKNAGSSPVFSFGANPMDASSLAAMAAAASGSSSGMIPDHMAAATAGFFADGASWEALRRTYAAAEQMAAVEDGHNNSSNNNNNPYRDHDRDHGGYDYDDYDDDDDDDQSFENRELTFEELEFLLHHRKQKEEAAKLASQFASGDWESLEQVAINDHLLSEADDKERKAAKKREKKQRRKAKLKEEAAQKAAEATQKKREKAIVSWRSRVVSACQSNEITKLDGLLQESPLRKVTEDEDDTNDKSYNNNNNNNGKTTNGNHLSTSCIIPHLEFLLPNSVAKNRAHVERGIEARLRLADYVLHSELSLAFQPLRTGRTALHTACFHGDVRFLQLLFDKIESCEPTEGETSIPSSFLNLTCGESGWSPLHYASISGSSETMELLLAKGSELSTRTDVTHTWRESDGRGLTTRELVHCVQSGNYEEVIETHGLALQEMTNAFFNHHQDRRIFMKKLERVHQRLSNVEKNGYTPLSNPQTDSAIESELKKEEVELNRSEASSSRNKKKKKKKKKQAGKEAESNNTAGASDVANPKNSALAQSHSIELKEERDPLVAALLGMGFNEEQIMAAVKACGGTHRATADDLVTWILGQGENEEHSQNPSEREENTQEGRSQTDQSQTEDSLGSNKHEDRQQEQDAARQKEETARRLAAKREEARRRNREWNNREQARQQKEAKAKVTPKLYAIPRPSIPVQSPVPPPGVGTSSKQKTRPRVPNGIHASHITGTTIGGIKSSTRQPPTANKWGVPPVTTQAHSFARPASQSNVGSSAVVTANEQQALPVSSFFTSINDDDKTVSSFGSSRCMSVSSKEVPFASHPSVPPPGFTPSVAQPVVAHIRPPVSTVPEDPSAVPFTEKRHEGEIRATAKEFVPSFTIPDSGNSDESVPSNDRSPSQSSQSNDVVFPPGMLPQQGGSAISRNSFLGPSLQNGLPNSFDNTPSMTPPSTESIVPGTSFIVGAKTGEPAMTIPFGFGQGDSNESNGICSSRILNSIAMNQPVGGASIWGEGQNVPSLETTLHPSFLGDRQNIPSLETTLHPSFFGDKTHPETSDEKNTSSYWW